MRARTRDRNPSASAAPRSGGGQRGGRSQPHGKSQTQGKSQGPGKSQAQGKGGPTKKQRGRGRPQPTNRNRRQRRSSGGPSFWGDPTKLPAARTDVRITDDPAAIPRSLGVPPLPGHEVIAEHYFTAVYDRAVATAGALAAAGGLIDPHALLEED